MTKRHVQVGCLINLRNVLLAKSEIKKSGFVYMQQTHMQKLPCLADEWVPELMEK